MVKKRMALLLKKKIDNWLKTIKDEELVENIKTDLIITGGAITSMILREKPKDFDCYFKTKQTLIKVANYYVDLYNKEKETKVIVLDCGVEQKDDYLRRIAKNAEPDRVKIYISYTGVEGDKPDDPLDVLLEDTGLRKRGYIETIEELDEIKVEQTIKKEKKKYFPVFLSMNAITLSDEIQLVVRFWGNPKKIHSTYDFVHTRGYWTYDGEVVIPSEVYEFCTNKVLHYTGSLYPICSLFRIRKFLGRGWKINAGQILKIAMQISVLDMQDIQVLEDQLIGVDTLYFAQLVDELKKKKEYDPAFEATPGYIISLVDKIF